MTKETSPVIQINGKEYKESELTEKQLLLIEHVQDLDKKIGRAQFKLDQLNIARKGFMAMLTEDLEKSDEEK